MAWAFSPSARPFSPATKAGRPTSTLSVVSVSGTSLPLASFACSAASTFFSAPGCVMRMARSACAFAVIWSLGRVATAGAVDPVAVDLVGLAVQDACGVHRVHVALQHDLALAGSLEGADHEIGPRAGRSLAPLGLEARGLQASFHHVGHLEQAVDVEAA